MSSYSDEISEPRKRGFNYGTGFGSGPKPPAYMTGLVLERVLNKRSALASDEAWAHSMLVRDVRLAETEAEKAKAIQLLHEANDRVFTENRVRFFKRTMRLALRHVLSLINR